MRNCFASCCFSSGNSVCFCTRPPCPVEPKTGNCYQNRVSTKTHVRVTSDLLVFPSNIQNEMLHVCVIDRNRFEVVASNSEHPKHEQASVSLVSAVAVWGCCFELLTRPCYRKPAATSLKTSHTFCLSSRGKERNQPANHNSRKGADSWKTIGKCSSYKEYLD